MFLTYQQSTTAVIWTSDLFDYIQQVKAGSFTADAFAQFAWLIVPEVTAHGAGGPFDAYFAIRAPDAGNAFSFTAPIRDITVWTSVNGEAGTNLLTASQMNVSFASVLAAPTAMALELLLLRGHDTIRFSTAIEDSANDSIYGWNGNDTIETAGSGGTDRFYGGNGDDRLSIADSDPNTLQGGPSAFFGYGGAGNDTIFGDDRGDQLFGGTGNDSLSAFAGNDVVRAGAGHDQVNGGIGNDTLSGDAGNDLIVGGTGTDLLSGGEGVDRFVFFWGGVSAVIDSPVALSRRDIVQDFTHDEDLLVLRDIGAGTVTLRERAAFTGANQVRWITAEGNTTVFINTDSDLAPEMAIRLPGVTLLDAGDFQL